MQAKTLRTFNTTIVHVHVVNAVAYIRHSQEHFLNAAKIIQNVFVHSVGLHYCIVIISYFMYHKYMHVGR